MRRSPLSIKKIVIALPAGRKNLVHSNRIYISVTATVNIKLSHELINNVALLLYFIRDSTTLSYNHVARLPDDARDDQQN